MSRLTLDPAAHIHLNVNQRDEPFTVVVNLPATQTVHSDWSSHTKTVQVGHKSIRQKL